MNRDDRLRELGNFLLERRSRVRPADVGLPDGVRRRVPGLRREEVATLAGIGITWYTMLESGTASGVTPATLDAVATVLHLDPDERAYVHRLADARPGAPARETVDASTLGTLAAIEWAPAYVCTSQWLVPAWNEAMSLVWGIEAPGAAPFNIVTRMFRDPAMRAMHGDRFAAFASDLVGMVRGGLSSFLGDPEYRRMCDDLQSDSVFARAWKAFEVSTPLRPLEIEVDSAAIGIFRYRTVTLEVAGEDGHWIVVQVPNGECAVRLRGILLSRLKTDR